MVRVFCVILTFFWASDACAAVSQSGPSTRLHQVYNVQIGCVATYDVALGIYAHNLSDSQSGRVANHELLDAARNTRNVVPVLRQQFWQAQNAIWRLQFEAENGDTYAFAYEGQAAGRDLRFTLIAFDSNHRSRDVGRVDLSFGLSGIERVQIRVNDARAQLQNLHDRVLNQITRISNRWTNPLLDFDYTETRRQSEPDVHYLWAATRRTKTDSDSVGVFRNGIPVAVLDFDRGWGGVENVEAWVLEPHFFADADPQQLFVDALRKLTQMIPSGGYVRGEMSRMSLEVAPETWIGSLKELGLSIFSYDSVTDDLVLVKNAAESQSLLEPPKYSPILEDLSVPARLAHSRHLSSEDGRWSGNRLVEFLDDLEPVRPVTLWFENSKLHWIFDRDFALLRERTDFSQRVKDGVSILPAEFEDETRRRWEIIERSHGSDDNAEKAITRAAETDPFFAEIIRVVEILRKKGWNIELRGERPKVESYLSWLKAEALLTTISPLLLEGRVRDAGRALFEYLDTIHKYVQQRDAPFSSQIAEARNAESLRAHIVFRGTMHAPGLAEFLSLSLIHSQQVARRPELETPMMKLFELYKDVIPNEFESLEGQRFAARGVAMLLAEKAQVPVPHAIETSSEPFQELAVFAKSLSTDVIARISLDAVAP